MPNAAVPSAVMDGLLCRFRLTVQEVHTLATERPKNGAVESVDFPQNAVGSEDQRLRHTPNTCLILRHYCFNLRQYAVVDGDRLWGRGFPLRSSFQSRKLRTFPCKKSVLRSQHER